MTNKQELIIENYLINLNEIELGSIIKSMSGNKLKKIASNINLVIKSNDPKKLNSIFKIVPKVEFNKIESFAEKKINNFKNLYSISKKVVSKKLNTSEDKVKIGSAVLAIAASIDKNPKLKLKKYLNDTLSKTKKNMESYEATDFFTKNTVSVALASLATLIIGIPLSAIPVIGLPLIIIVFIGSFIASRGLFDE